MMPDGRFEFNYWNRLYEIERVGFTKSTDNQIILKTKESSLGRYGPQKGYYARMTLNLASTIEATASYQDMLGDIWSNLDGSFIEDKNQTFLASLRLKKAISKYNMLVHFISKEMFQILLNSTILKVQLLATN